MNRAALVDQIRQARGTLEKLLKLLQSAPVERDRFVSHLYQARKENTGERARLPENQTSKSSGASSRHSRSELLRLGEIRDVSR